MHLGTAAEQGLVRGVEVRQRPVSKAEREKKSKVKEFFMPYKATVISNSGKYCTLFFFQRGKEAAFLVFCVFFGVIYSESAAEL